MINNESNTTNKLYEYTTNSTNKLNFNKSINNNYSFINDVIIYDNIIDEELLYNIRDTEELDELIKTEICAQKPLFFINRNIIKIPTKIEHVLRRYTPKKLLREIHPDIDVAIELCLMFTTQLTSTYFEELKTSKEGWKSLRAEYLREYLYLNPKTYKYVIKALEHPTSKGPIIECDYDPIKGKKNHCYRFGEAYFGKGIVSYQLKTKVAQRFLNKHFIRISGKADTNPIVQNLVEFYEDVTLPTLEQIEEEADRLIGIKYRTKKGKLLKKLGKHSRSYFKNPQKYSFVEDAIKIFRYLTDDGLMYPEVGSERSGGRIVDSFTLMPSWIRQMIKINGEAMVEADYSCLHPNTAISLYGGTKEYLNHKDLVQAINKDIHIVKNEHLSFFNKQVWQMKESPLYEYYEKYEPFMLKNIIDEKYSSEYKHKITSRRLFAKEVEIMSDVIETLNSEFIYVGYVYDALICHPKDAYRVKEVMDSVILNHDVKTSAKLSNEKKDSFDEEALNESNDLDNLKSTSSDVVTDNNYIVVNSNQINFTDGIRDMVLDKINNGENVIFEDAIIEFDNKHSYYDKVLLINDKINPELKYVIESHILNPPIY